MLCKDGFPWSFTNFIGKHLYQSLSFNKFAKKRPWHRCFPANFEKFLRTSFPTEQLQWLLLIASTLKNSQSSVTLKNECKQFGYCFPNEIKNSTHSNEKISRLKNKKGLKHIHKNIFINLFGFKWWTNITFQNVSFKGLKRKQNALKLETTCMFSWFFAEWNNKSVQRSLNIYFKNKN